jgi:FkbM family methyltransferase
MRVIRETLKKVAPSIVLETYRARSSVQAAARLLPAIEIEAMFLGLLCDRTKVSVDVGGNMGAYTKLLRDLSRRVHVFEPNSILVHRLRLAFFMDSRVTIHAAGLSAREGYAQLRVPSGADVAMDGLATIEPENKLGNLSFTETKVPIRTLDTAIGRDQVGFIKIDVEGHELDVLKGAVRVLHRDAPNLLIEATEHHRSRAVLSLREFLASFGYEGMFFDEGRLHDIMDFDPLLHQREDSLDRFANRRTGQRYVANFIFATHVNDMASKIGSNFDIRGRRPVLRSNS